MTKTYGTPVYSADGVVAAPHYLATLAGIEVLRDGGSAVDTAIAANLVLGVVWPHMCGIGGDLMAHVWSARPVTELGGAAPVFLPSGHPLRRRARTTRATCSQAAEATRSICARPIATAMS